MSELNLTEGAWVVKFDDMIFATDGIDNEQVAVVFNRENQDKYLIAAAPDMYGTLDNILFHFKTGAVNDPELNEALIPVIEEVLAQARGENHE